MLNKKLGKYLPILALSLLGTKKYYMHWADNKSILVTPDAVVDARFRLCHFALARHLNLALAAKWLSVRGIMPNTMIGTLL